MTSTDPLSASCLCGAVTITFHHKPSHLDVCHCGMGRQCGTHLYWQVQGRVLYFIPAGFFPDLTDVPFTEAIFSDERPAYYAFANDTTKLTGEEVVLKYASLTRHAPWPGPAGWWTSTRPPPAPG